MALEDKTLQELRQLARARGVTGYSKLTKPQLIAQLSGNQAAAKKAAAKGVAKEASPKRRKADAERRARSRPAPGVDAGTIGAAAEQEQLVEDLKFALTPERAVIPREPLADLGEDIENLPPITDPFICLMPQKPGVLHGYWTLSPGAAKRDPGLKLRLCAFDNDKLHILTEVAVPADHGHWYFHVGETLSDQSVYLQLGYYKDGEFITAIRRGIARIPSLRASVHEDREWWVSPERFQEMYERAGGIAEADSLHWKSDNSFSSR